MCSKCGRGFFEGRFFCAGCGSYDVCGTCVKQDKMWNRFTKCGDCLDGVLKEGRDRRQEEKTDPFGTRAVDYFPADYEYDPADDDIGD